MQPTSTFYRRTKTGNCELAWQAFLIISLVEPYALKEVVTATPETSAYVRVQFNVPERREERYATQNEGEELKKKRQSQNPVIPRERLLLFFSLHFIRRVLTVFQ